MSKESRDVTREYDIALAASKKYDPGSQPNIAALMRAAYTHGYADALLAHKKTAEADQCPVGGCVLTKGHQNEHSDQYGNSFIAPSDYAVENQLPDSDRRIPDGD